MKEDFRNGLKVLDDEAEENRNPETFDPTKDLRDYSAIDLPVFTVSSRDYVRIRSKRASLFMAVEAALTYIPSRAGLGRWRQLMFRPDPGYWNS